MDINFWIILPFAVYEVGALVSAYGFMVTEKLSWVRKSPLFPLKAFIFGQITAILVLCLLLILVLRTIFTILGIAAVWVTYWTGRWSQGGPLPAKVKTKEQVRSEVGEYWQGLVKMFRNVFPKPVY